MDLANMIEAATWEFKQKLTVHCENLDKGCLTPQLAEAVTQGLKSALQGAGTVAFRTFLEAYEVDETPKEVDGVLYRFKQQSEKTFLTPFGEMILSINASAMITLTNWTIHWLHRCAIYYVKLRQHPKKYTCDNLSHAIPPQNPIFN